MSSFESRNHRRLWVMTMTMASPRIFSATSTRTGQARGRGVSLWLMRESGMPTIACVRRASVTDGSCSL